MFITHVHKSQAKQIMAEWKKMPTCACVLLSWVRMQVELYSVHEHEYKYKWRKKWRTTDLAADKDAWTEQEMDVSSEAQMYVCLWVYRWAATKLPAGHLTELAPVHAELCQSQREDWPLHLPNLLASLSTCMWHFFKTSQNIPSWSWTTSINANTLKEVIWTEGWYCFRGMIADSLHTMA